MTQVIIYKTPFCPYCMRAKSLLIKKGLEKNIKEIDITQDPQLLSEMLAKTGGKRTVPQIFINDQYVGNCNELYDYDKEGKLDILLSS